MQQLLVVLAVHLMSVVAGPGRAGAAPVQSSSTSTTALLSHHNPGAYHHRLDPSVDLSPWSEKQSMNADSRRERSLGVWHLTRAQKILTNKHGWTLEIMPNGSVTASRDIKPKYGIFETDGVSPHNLGLTSTGASLNNTEHYGKVELLGLHSHMYLCMRENGTIFTRHRDDQIKEFKQECVFVETLHQHYFLTYCSYKFPRPKLRKDGTEKKSKKSNKRWCIGINKNGTIRLGKRTKERHSFAHFQSRPVEDPVTQFPRPASETTRPVSRVTSPPPPRGGNINPTESLRGRRKNKRKRRRNRPRDRKNCSESGLFNVKCRDDGEVIRDISELNRKSSRRRTRGRSRSSSKRRRSRNRKSRVETIGLFTS